jgi:hypothetical protein
MLSPLSLHKLLQRVVLDPIATNPRNQALPEQGQRPNTEQALPPPSNTSPAILDATRSPLLAALQLPKEAAVAHVAELRALLQAWLDGLGKPEAILRLLAPTAAPGTEPAGAGRSLSDEMVANLPMQPRQLNLDVFHALESQWGRPSLWELLPQELQQLAQFHGTAGLSGEWRRTFAFLQRLDPGLDAALIAFLAGQGPLPFLSEATLQRIAGQDPHPLRQVLSLQALVSFHAQIAGSLPGPPLLQPLVEGPVPLSLLNSPLGGEPSERIDFPRQWFAFMQRIDRTLFTTWAAYVSQGRLPPSAALAELPRALKSLVDPTPIRLSFSSIAEMEQSIATWDPSIFKLLQTQFTDPKLAETWRAWVSLDPERQALFSFLDGLAAPQLASIRQLLLESPVPMERLARAWGLMKNGAPVLDSWPLPPPDLAGMSRLLDLGIPTRSPILLPQRAELRVLLRALVFDPAMAEAGVGRTPETQAHLQLLGHRWPQLDDGQRQHALRQLVATLPRRHDLGFLETAAGLLNGESVREADLQRLLRYARGQKQAPDRLLAWQDPDRASLLGQPAGSHQFYVDLHSTMEVHTRRQAAQALRTVLFKAELGHLIESTLHGPGQTAHHESLFSTLARGVGILLGKPVPFQKSNRAEAQISPSSSSTGPNPPAQATEIPRTPGDYSFQDSPAGLAQGEREPSTLNFEQSLPQQQLKLAHGWPLHLSLWLKGREEFGELHQMVWNLADPRKGILWVAQFLFPRAGAVRLDVLALSIQRQATFWCEKPETRAKLAEGAEELRKRLRSDAGSWQLSFFQDGRRARCGPGELGAEILRSGLDLRA